MRTRSPVDLIVALRIALGVVLILGGVKLAFNPDPLSLAASYIDPGSGWISPPFADWITKTLGAGIADFLRIQGFLEIILGLLLIAGILTPVFATVAALMFWSFAVANPIVGEVRLSRDLALMASCFAVTAFGAGSFSLDRTIGRIYSDRPERWDLSLAFIRFGLAYTLLASSLFTEGVFANQLNSTLPVALVAALGLALVAGIVPRWIMAVIAAWLIYLVVAALVTRGTFAGLDSVKREIGLLAAASVYAAGGPDRWSWPRLDPHRGRMGEGTSEHVEFPADA